VADDESVRRERVVNIGQHRTGFNRHGSVPWADREHTIQRPHVEHDSGPNRARAAHQSRAAAKLDDGYVLGRGRSNRGDDIIGAARRHGEDG